MVIGPPPIRVIVAEDDLTVREALADLIRATPTLELVAAVVDATEVARAARAAQPDVAVVDVRMPGGGGALAARRIARCSPHTKVLALSAADDRENVTRMLESGAVGYLTKGVAPGAIIESIEAAAAGRGTLSAEVTGGVIQQIVERGEFERRLVAQSRRRRRRIERAVDDPTALQVFLQPIYDLGSYQAVAVEALARFRGPPAWGPDRWFAEAAQVGLELELELAACAKALAELAGLTPGVDMTVNGSPATVASPGFLALVADADPERTIVEITEHAPITDYNKFAAALVELRQLGVRVAVDDAGAGFASLRHILRLAPQFIKLDRSLIDGIAADRSQQALAASLITFAERTDAMIIAEGIEQEAEMDALRELGVSFGQGYLLARPAAPPFSRLVASRGLRHSSADA
jgi:EAL domain-containing protein (putative c-di-GMP-specific phosphodiesterase class I)/CheY-like chemotaxis protein